MDNKDRGTCTDESSRHRSDGTCTDESSRHRSDGTCTDESSRHRSRGTCTDESSRHRSRGTYLLMKLHDLEEKGIKLRKRYTMEDDPDEMEYEYNYHLKRIEEDNMLEHILLLALYHTYYNI